MYSSLSIYFPITWDLKSPHDIKEIFMWIVTEPHKPF